jgi:hypothetical protein
MTTSLRQSSTDPNVRNSPTTSHACDRPVVETSFDVRTGLHARGHGVPLCADSWLVAKPIDQRTPGDDGPARRPERLANQP